MPASRITLLQRSVSSCLSFAMSCGLPPPALTWRSRKRALVAASLRMSFIARFNFEPGGGGRLGGRVNRIRGAEGEPGHADLDRGGTARNEMGRLLGRDGEISRLAPLVQFVGGGELNKDKIDVTRHEIVE